MENSEINNLFNESLSQSSLENILFGKPGSNSRYSIDCKIHLEILYTKLEALIEDSDTNTQNKLIKGNEIKRILNKDSSPAAIIKAIDQLFNLL